MNKPIYMLFYDRVYRAQDNAEHMYRWVAKNHPEITVKYILNSTSSDWDRLKAEGFNLINGLNRLAVQSELMRCDYAISSIFTEGTGFDFSKCLCRRVFLNHGCFLAPINYIKDERANIDLFIAANKLEYNTLLHPYHGLSKNQVALCGQPRQDDLALAQNKPHEENTILIQFWQRPKEWAKDNNKQFLASDFYKKTSAILTNKKLLDICEKNGLKLVFKMHSIQYDWLKYYKKFESKLVHISPLSELFEPEFIKSKFIITDISSNAYEMAKINKPCIYFEPDPEELFNWRYTKNGGFEFDLVNNSIGPVIYKDINRLVQTIEQLIKNDFVLDKKYRDRRQSQIYFINDTNNCKRCFEAMLELGESLAVKKQREAMIKASRADGQVNTYLYF